VKTPYACFSKIHKKIRGNAGKNRCVMRHRSRYMKLYKLRHLCEKPRNRSLLIGSVSGTNAERTAKTKSRYTVLLQVSPARLWVNARRFQEEPSRQESRALGTRRPKMPYVAISAKIKKGTYQLPGRKNQIRRSRRFGSSDEKPLARLNKILGKKQILRETAKGVKEESS